MRLIDRKLSRDLWAIKGRMLALALIIASGVGILFGIELALGNLRDTQEAFLASRQFADLEITLLPEDASNLPDLASVAGVATMEQRLVLPGRIALPGDQSLAGLVLFQQRPDPALNQLQMLEGRAFVPGAAEVVIDKALADHHHFGLDDRIEVRVGRSRFDYRIVGIARSPEFLVTTSNPDYVIVQPGSLGVLWADAGRIRDVLGFSMVDSLLFRFAEGADPQAVTAQLMKKLRQTNVEKVTPRAESYGYKQVRMELTAFGVYSPAIIVTLCVLSLAMGIITFRRFMLEKQREFGVLAAMGYRRAQVFAALLRIGLVIGLVGALLGLAIGWGMAWAFAEVYAHAMHLPYVVHAFDWPVAAASLLVGLGSGCLAVLVAAVPMLRLSPRQQLVATSSDTSRTPGGPLRSFGVMFRYSVRSLLRERTLTVSSMLAMGGSIAVAIAYGLAMTSTFGTVEHSFSQELWTHAVDFQYPLYTDEAQALQARARAGAAEPYYRTAADFRNGDRHSVGLLVGLRTPGKMRRLLPASGREASRDDEAVISSDLARDLGLGLGGRLGIEKGNLAREVTVVGITNDIYLRTVNVGLPLVQQLAQSEDKVTGMYLETDAAGAETLAANVEDVARVTQKDALVEHFRRQMADKMGIVYITILFSVGVSILFVTTLVHLGIAEKRGEYAVLRSLGFTVRRLRGLILTGVAIQVALSLLLSVPLALALVRLLNERMGRAWFAVDLYASVPDFLWPMLAALLVAPVVGVLGARAVLYLNIPQFLRGRAI